MLNPHKIKVSHLNQWKLQFQKQLFNTLPQTALKTSDRFQRKAGGRQSGI
jgi:hypothetical protein